MQAGSRGFAAATFSTHPNWTGYLLSVPPAERLRLQGVGGGRGQKFLTVSAMVGLVTAVLVGSADGLLAAVVSDHSLIAALIAGVLAAIAVFTTALIHFQVSVRRQAALLLDDGRAQTTAARGRSGAV